MWSLNGFVIMITIIIAVRRYHNSTLQTPNSTLKEKSSAVKSVAIRKHEETQ